MSASEHTPVWPVRMAVLGLGLIGGSLALAAKKHQLVSEVVGWGRSEASLQKGLELGVIDRYSLHLEEAVEGCELIVVATPVLVAEQLLVRLFADLQTTAIVTDVSSTKGNLLAAVKNALGRVPARLVLGHPIAGAETSGVTAAQESLFVNHRVILTPVEQTDADALRLVTALWEKTGAEVVQMSTEQHDTVLAATSHLPHMLAYALVDALSSMEQEQEIFRFAAGGFRDFTRIAKSSPQMWHDIALANKAAIISSIDKFSAHLDTLRNTIEAGDSQALYRILEQVSNTRKNLHNTVLPKKH